MDDLNLYDDLDEFQEQQERKSKELQEAEERYQQSLKVIEELKEENKTLKKNIKRIELGFQSLLDTARSEIRRKDKEIERLRKELDDICFRRKNPNKITNTNEGSNLHNNISVDNPFKQKDVRRNEVPAEAEKAPKEVLDKSKEKYEKSDKRCRANAEEDDRLDSKRLRNDHDNKHPHRSYKHQKTYQKTEDERHSNRYRYRENTSNWNDNSRNRIDNVKSDDVNESGKSQRHSEKNERYRLSSHRSRSRERDRFKDNHHKSSEGNTRRQESSTAPGYSNSFSNSFPFKNDDSKQNHFRNEKNFQKSNVGTSKNLINNKDVGEENITNLQNQQTRITTEHLKKESKNKAGNEKQNVEKSKRPTKETKIEDKQNISTAILKDELRNISEKIIYNESENNMKNKLTAPEIDKLSTPCKVKLFDALFGKSPSECGSTSEKSNIFLSNVKGILAKTSQIEVVSSATTSPGDYTDIDSSVTTPTNQTIETLSSGSSTSNKLASDEQCVVAKRSRDEIDECFVLHTNMEQNFKTIACVDLTEIVDDDIGNEIDFIEIPGLDLCGKKKDVHNTGNLQIFDKQENTNAIRKQAKSNSPSLDINCNTTLESHEIAEVVNVDICDKNQNTQLQPTDAIRNSDNILNDSTNKVVVIDNVQCDGDVLLGYSNKFKGTEQEMLISNRARDTEDCLIKFEKPASKESAFESLRNENEENVNQPQIENPLSITVKTVLIDKLKLNSAEHNLALKLQVEQSLLEARNFIKNTRAETDISLLQNEKEVELKENNTSLCEKITLDSTIRKTEMSNILEAKSNAIIGFPDKEDGKGQICLRDEPHILLSERDNTIPLTKEHKNIEFKENEESNVKITDSILKSNKEEINEYENTLQEDVEEALCKEKQIEATTEIATKSVIRDDPNSLLLEREDTLQLTGEIKKIENTSNEKFETKITDAESESNEEGINKSQNCLKGIAEEETLRNDEIKGTIQTAKNKVMEITPTEDLETLSVILETSSNFEHPNNENVSPKDLKNSAKDELNVGNHYLKKAELIATEQPDGEEIKNKELRSQFYNQDQENQNSFTVLSTKELPDQANKPLDERRSDELENTNDLPSLSICETEDSARFSENPCKNDYESQNSFPKEANVLHTKISKVKVQSVEVLPPIKISEIVNNSCRTIQCNLETEDTLVNEEHPTSIISQEQEAENTKALETSLREEKLSTNLHTKSAQSLEKISSPSQPEESSILPQDNLESESREKENMDKVTETVEELQSEVVQIGEENLISSPNPETLDMRSQANNSPKKSIEVRCNEEEGDSISVNESIEETLIIVSKNSGEDNVTCEEKLEEENNENHTCNMGRISNEMQVPMLRQKDENSCSNLVPDTSVDDVFVLQQKSFGKEILKTNLDKISHSSKSPKNSLDVRCNEEENSVSEKASTEESQIMEEKIFEEGNVIYEEKLEQEVDKNLAVPILSQRDENLSSIVEPDESSDSVSVFQEKSFAKEILETDSDTNNAQNLEEISSSTVLNDSLNFANDDRVKKLGSSEPSKYQPDVKLDAVGKSKVVQSDEENSVSTTDPEDLGIVASKYHRGNNMIDVSSDDKESLIREKIPIRESSDIGSTSCEEKKTICEENLAKLAVTEPIIEENLTSNIEQPSSTLSIPAIVENKDGAEEDKISHSLEDTLNDTLDDSVVLIVSDLDLTDRIEETTEDTQTSKTENFQTIENTKTFENELPSISTTTTMAFMSNIKQKDLNEITEGTTNVLSTNETSISSSPAITSENTLNPVFSQKETSFNLPHKEAPNNVITKSVSNENVNKNNLFIDSKAPGNDRGNLPSEGNDKSQENIAVAQENKNSNSITDQKQPLRAETIAEINLAEISLLKAEDEIRSHDTDEKLSSENPAASNRFSDEASPKQVKEFTGSDQKQPLCSETFAEIKINIFNDSKAPGYDRVKNSTNLPSEGNDKSQENIEVAQENKNSNSTSDQKQPLRSETFAEINLEKISLSKTEDEIKSHGTDEKLSSENPAASNTFSDEASPKQVKEFTGSDQKQPLCPETFVEINLKEISISKAEDQIRSHNTDEVLPSKYPAPSNMFSNEASQKQIKEFSGSDQKQPLCSETFAEINLKEIPLSKAGDQKRSHDTDEKLPSANLVDSNTFSDENSPKQIKELSGSDQKQPLRPETFAEINLKGISLSKAEDQIRSHDTDEELHLENPAAFNTFSDEYSPKQIKELSGSDQKQPLRPEIFAEINLKEISLSKAEDQIRSHDTDEEHHLENSAASNTFADEATSKQIKEFTCSNKKECAFSDTADAISAQLKENVSTGANKECSCTDINTEQNLLEGKVINDISNNIRATVKPLTILESLSPLEVNHKQVLEENMSLSIEIPSSETTGNENGAARSIKHDKKEGFTKDCSQIDDKEGEMLKEYCKYPTKGMRKEFSDGKVLLSKIVYTSVESKEIMDKAQEEPFKQQNLEEKLVPEKTINEEFILDAKSTHVANSNKENHDSVKENPEIVEKEEEAVKSLKKAVENANNTLEIIQKSSSNLLESDVVVSDKNMQQKSKVLKLENSTKDNNKHRKVTYNENNLEKQKHAKNDSETIQGDQSLLLDSKILNVENLKPTYGTSSILPVSKQAKINRASEHLPLPPLIPFKVIQKSRYQTESSKQMLNLQETNEPIEKLKLAEHAPKDNQFDGNILQTSCIPKNKWEFNEVVPQPLSLNNSQFLAETKKIIYVKKVVTKEINIEGEIVEVVKNIVDLNETLNMEMMPKCSGIALNCGNGHYNEGQLQSFAFEPQIKTVPILPTTSQNLPQSLTILPSISTISPTPSNFSGIFSKMAASMPTGEEELSILKKKPALLCIKPKEYILPAVSVLCNVDNLENATKINKKIHWELLDNKNEMTEIEDDANVDTTDDEVLKIKEEPLENASSSPKQNNLQNTLQKPSPSETDTQTEDESLLNELRQPKGRPKKLKASKVLKKKSKLSKTVKARLKAIAKRGANSASSLVPQEPISLGLLKRSVGRPRKSDKREYTAAKPLQHKKRGRKPKSMIESHTMESTKCIILSSKLDNYKEIIKSSKSGESSDIQSEIICAKTLPPQNYFGEPSKRDINLIENITKSLDVDERNIPKNLNSIEYSMRSLSSSVEKLEICDETCSSKDSSKQILGSSNLTPCKQNSSKEEIDYSIKEKRRIESKDPHTKETTEKGYCELFNVKGQENSFITMDKHSEVTTCSVRTPGIDSINQNGLADSDSRPVDQPVLSSVERKWTGNSLTVDSVNKAVQENNAVNTSCSEPSEVQINLNSENSTKSKPLIKPYFKKKLPSKSLENQVKNFISLEDIGIKVRPPKAHLSSFRIPKIKKNPEDVIDSSWKLETYLEIDNKEDKGKREQINEPENVEKIVQEQKSENEKKTEDNKQSCSEVSPEQQKNSQAKVNEMKLTPKGVASVENLKPDNAKTESAPSKFVIKLDDKTKKGRRKLYSPDMYEEGDTIAANNSPTTTVIQTTEQSINTIKLPEPDPIKTRRKSVHFSRETNNFDSHETKSSKPLSESQKITVQRRILDSSSDEDFGNSAKKEKLSTRKMNETSPQDQTPSIILKQNYANKSPRMRRKSVYADTSSLEREGGQVTNSDIHDAKSSKSSGELQKRSIKLHRRILDSSSDEDSGNAAKKEKLSPRELNKFSQNKSVRLRRKSMYAKTSSLEQEKKDDFPVLKSSKKSSELHKIPKKSHRRILDSSSDEDFDNSAKKEKLTTNELSKSAQNTKPDNHSKAMPQDQINTVASKTIETIRSLRLRRKSIYAETSFLESEFNQNAENDKVDANSELPRRAQETIRDKLESSSIKINSCDKEQQPKAIKSHKMLKRSLNASKEAPLTQQEKLQKKSYNEANFITNINENKDQEPTITDLNTKTKIEQIKPITSFKMRRKSMIAKSPMNNKEDKDNLEKSKHLMHTSTLKMRRKSTSTVAANKTVENVFPVINDPKTDLIKSNSKENNEGRVAESTSDFDLANIAPLQNRISRRRKSTHQRNISDDNPEDLNRNSEEIKKPKRDQVTKTVALTDENIKTDDVGNEPEYIDVGSVKETLNKKLRRKSTNQQSTLENRSAIVVATAAKVEDPQLNPVISEQVIQTSSKVPETSQNMVDPRFISTVDLQQTEKIKIRRNSSSHCQNSKIENTFNQEIQHDQNKQNIDHISCMQVDSDATANKLSRESTANSCKSFDSSYEDKPDIKKPTVIPTEVISPPIFAEKPKQRRRRVVKVLSTSMDSPKDSINTSQQSSNQSSPYASPLLNHPIFNNEVSTQSTEFAVSLPMTPNQQDDHKLKEIDSKLNELFQSPVYTTDYKNSSALAASNLSLLPAPLNDSQPNVTIDETLDFNRENDHSSLNVSQVNNSSISLNDFESLHNKSEVKHLSLGSNDYRIEKVSDNQINLFISRKRRRKPNN